MEYQVGDYVDLTVLNKQSDAPSRKPSTNYERFLAGTKVTFLTMASGVLLMSIVEASGQIHVTFS